MPSITGQSILVIGGSSGIGFAVAKQVLEEKVASLAIASSSADRVANAVERLKAAYPDTQTTITGHTIDLASATIEADLEALLSAVTSGNTTKLDHLVSTAGRIHLKQLADVDLPFLQNLAHERTFTNILLGKLAPRFLNPGPRSSVTYTTGQVAVKPPKGWGMMSGFASGAFGMVRGMAVDLAPLRFNVVSPGATDTELWGTGERAEMMRKHVAEKSLLGKPGSAEDLAEAYIYLMRNTDANGSVVTSDAGSVLL